MWGLQLVEFESKNCQNMELVYNSIIIIICNFSLRKIKILVKFNGITERFNLFLPHKKKQNH